MRTNKIPMLAVMLLTIGIGSLVASLVYNAMAYPSQGWENQYGQGMMGNSMMGSGMMDNGMMNGGMMGNGGNGMMGGQISSIDNSTFNQINTSPNGVTVNRTANTVWVRATGVTLLIEAAPLWYPHPGEFWLVYGLVNPTIIVKQGVEVNFLFINMDNETHVPAITAMPPPYPYMPMMSGMMNGNYGFRVGSMLAGVQASAIVSNLLYTDTTLSFAFTTMGTYWYPCLYLDHAEMGMYGEIQVVN